MALADEVRTRRRAMKLSQHEVALLADVSERFVREVETGKSSLRLDKLEAVLDVLGLQLALTPRETP
ncbi:type II toxin-antitoxin system Y4mF family antitoxin [Kytococcus sp. Marseille-QA3725]